MIESYTGLPGSGKTLNAVRRLLQAKAKGIPTFANFHSRSKSWDYVLFNDIKYLETGLVVLDEAHMSFSSRNWSKTTQEQLGLFQQHRKLGIDLIWIAQSASRVDLALRELTAYEHQHMKFGRFVRVRVIDPAMADSKRRPIKRYWYYIERSITDHYYTEERIGDINGRGAGFGRLGASGDGPPANWVRAEFMGHVELVPIDRLNPTIEYDSLIPLYRDIYGRFTEIEGSADLRVEASSLMEAYKRVQNSFFSSPSPSEGLQKKNF